jgi:hypothetical protein
MRFAGRSIVAAFFLFPPWTLGFAQGRAPKNPVLDGLRVSAERVFVRALPAGGDGYYAVWNSSVTTGETFVLGQRFGVDDSARWPASGLALARGLSEAGLWDTCSDSQGGLITAAGEKGRLMIRRTNPDGVLVWEKIVVPYTSASPVTTVIAIPDGHGGAFLTWAQGAPENSTVWVQQWDGEGRPVWPLPGVQAAPADSHQLQPNILADGQGGVVAAWKSFHEDISRVRGQRFTVDGKRLWTDAGVGVQTPAGDLRQRIVMVAPGSGSLVVTWTQGAEGINRLYFQRVEPDGTRSWSGGGITALPPILEQWNPVLLANGDDSVWIGWEEVQPGGDAKVKLIRRGPPNGEPWAPGEIGLANTDGSQGKLALALDGAGSVLAAWIENRSDVGLYLQELDSQGRLRYPTGNKVAANLKRPQYPHLVLAAPGRAAVVWVEEKGKQLWELKHRVVDFH